MPSIMAPGQNEMFLLPRMVLVLPEEVQERLAPSAMRAGVSQGRGRAPSSASSSTFVAQYPWGVSLGCPFCFRLRCRYGPFGWGRDLAELLQAKESKECHLKDEHCRRRNRGGDAEDESAREEEGLVAA